MDNETFSGVGRRYKPNEEPSIGVVLCTYNGAAYLAEQLDCLLRQDCPPNHLVIADDGSTDATLKMIEKFASSAPFRTDLLCDQSRLGATKNFLRAAAACKADLIAFCDQDDLWRSDKLQKARRAFSNRAVWGAIHAFREFRTSATGDRVEGRLVRLPSRVVDGLQLAPIILWPGMSLIVRSEVLEVAMTLRTQWHARFAKIAYERPLAIEDYWCHMHDALLINTARLLGLVAMISEPLADHRLHAQNHSQTKKPSWTQDKQIQDGWGPSRTVPYRKLEHFCADFSSFLADTATTVLAPERNREAVATYTRWAGIWRERASLHVENARLIDRVAAYARLHTAGSYRDKRRGGLGIRSLVKDGAAVAGVRFD